MTESMKPRILIIDENRRNLRFAKALIERVNRCEARMESDPHAAVAVACEFRPDVVVVDFELTDMDGCDVACALRAEPAFARVPIVFITSLFAPTETPEEFVEHGSVSVLPKPVMPRRFCKSLNEILAAMGWSGQAGLN